MTVERYRVGRASYNWQNRISIGMGAEDADALREALSGPVAIAEERVEPAVRWATATLQQKNMPLDPNAWCYSDKDWRRKKERRSAEWYAIKILQEASWLRLMIEKGEARMAADFALDLGELITEAHFIFNVYVRQGMNAAAHTNSLKRQDPERAARSERWRTLAAAAWEKDPTYGALAIAERIEPDPTKRRTCRRVIGPLNPRKRK
jgi:hypothetical protein